MNTHKIDNPYTGETVAERKFIDDSEVEGLVSRAFRAHKAWTKTPLEGRIAVVERFC